MPYFTSTVNFTSDISTYKRNHWRYYLLEKCNLNRILYINSCDFCFDNWFGMFIGSGVLDIHVSHWYDLIATLRDYLDTHICYIGSQFATCKQAAENSVFELHTNGLAS